MSERNKPWYELTDEERDMYAHRRAVAVAVCFVAMILIAIWEHYGWQLRFYRFGSSEYHNEETAQDYTYSVYYDRDARVLFHIQEGREPLFELDFSKEDEEPDPWRWMHSVHNTDYGFRYWYEHASELTAALEGWDFEISLDHVKRLFCGLVVHIPGEGDDAKTDAEQVRGIIRAMAIGTSHFSNYNYIDGAPVVTLNYDSGERDDESVRLTSHW